MMMTQPSPTQSALSNFLGEILNDSACVQIQNDNARMLAADSCCSQQYQRQRRRRPQSNNNSMSRFSSSSSQPPPQHQRQSISPFNATIQDDQHRIVHKASARWETHMTSNDFIVTAPLRRKVYCEPEKIMGGYQLPPMRSAQIPLRELAGQFHNTTGTNSAKQAPASPTSPSLVAGSNDQDSKSEADLTSNLLDEALDLLAE